MIDRRALLAAAATTLFSGAARAAAPKRQERPISYPLVGRQAPTFTAVSAYGAAFSSTSLRGRWAIIDFWGVWCPECLVDAPHVNALASAVAQDPALRLLAVHVGNDTGRWPSVGAYMDEKGIEHDVVVDPWGEIWRAFALHWVPAYVVLDPEGVIRGFRTDLAREAAPEGGVKAFIKEIAGLRAEG